MEEMSQSIVEIIDKNARDTGSYIAALIALLPVIPIVATLLTIVTFVGQRLKTPVGAAAFSWVDASIPLLVGTIGTLILWLLVAIVGKRFTTVDKVHSHSYYSLLDHLSVLNASLDTFLPEDIKQETLEMLLRAKIRSPRPDTEPNVAPQSAKDALKSLAISPCVSDTLQEVLYCRNAICLALMKPTTSWIIGSAYTEIWDWMDRAEEACFLLAPLEKVVGEAIYDEMRLNDSKIDNSEEWANKLRSAVKSLNADAVRYLKPAIGIPDPKDAGEISQVAPASPVSDQQGDVLKSQQAQARAILRKVRKMINDFNTKSWHGLVNARNQLLATMILVGFATYVFIELAILMQVKTSHIIVATVIAFVGALAGLIGRLSQESQNGTAIDDYHLSVARLLVTPLLSALAAVIGVLIVAKATSLDAIYTFSAIVPNLLIAATFGLTPNVLINQLKRNSDTYKGNLQSTTPTMGK